MIIGRSRRQFLQKLFLSVIGTSLLPTFAQARLTNPSEIRQILDLYRSVGDGSTALGAVELYTRNLKEKLAFDRDRVTNDDFCGARLLPAIKSRIESVERLNDIALYYSESQPRVFYNIENIPGAIQDLHLKLESRNLLSRIKAEAESTKPLMVEDFERIKKLDVTINELSREILRFSMYFASFDTGLFQCYYDLDAVVAPEILNLRRAVWGFLRNFDTRLNQLSLAEEALRQEIKGEAQSALDIVRSEIRVAFFIEGLRESLEDEIYTNSLDRNEIRSAVRRVEALSHAAELDIQSADAMLLQDQLSSRKIQKRIQLLEQQGTRLYAAGTVSPYRCPDGFPYSECNHTMQRASFDNWISSERSSLELSRSRLIERINENARRLERLRASMLENEDTLKHYAEALRDLDASDQRLRRRLEEINNDMSEIEEKPLQDWQYELRRIISRA